MFPVTTLEKFSGQNGRASGQEPAACDASRASANPLPPLALEKESTRRAREAKARELRKQDELEGEVWSQVWSTGWDPGQATKLSLAGPARRTVHNLALAPEREPPPEREQEPITVQQAQAPIKISTDQARRSLVAARKADAEGDWHTAINHYTVVVENGSSDAQAHYRLGVLLLQTHGDPRQSLAHLRKAILLRPQQLKYRRALATLYENLGFPINARSQREQIRRLEQDAAAKRARQYS